MCDIIEFPRHRITAAPDHSSAVAAVELCEGIPERLFDLALASLTIAKGSGNLVTDRCAVDCLSTAFVALSELLGITGEARQ